jgi:hypothetical protein
LKAFGNFRDVDLACMLSDATLDDASNYNDSLDGVKKLKARSVV